MQFNNGTIFFIVVGLILFILVLASGVLVWAIPGGLVVSAVFWLVTRDIKLSLTVGTIVTVVIAAVGIATLISPDWYKA